MSMVLLMAEIRLTTWDVQNPVNNGINMDKLPTNWRRISSINSMSHRFVGGNLRVKGVECSGLDVPTYRAGTRELNQFLTTYTPGI